MTVASDDRSFGWRRGAVRAPAGWLALLRQDQLVAPRDAEPVLFLAVLDDELASRAKEVFCPDDRRARRGQRGAGVGRVTHTRLVCGRSMTSLPRRPRRNSRGKNTRLAPAR